MLEMCARGRATDVTQAAQYVGGSRQARCLYGLRHLPLPQLRVREVVWLFACFYVVSTPDSPMRVRSARKDAKQYLLE